MASLDPLAQDLIGCHPDQGWFLAGQGLPAFLATWASPQGSSQHGNWFYSEQERVRKREKENAQDRNLSPFVT